MAGKTPFDDIFKRNLGALNSIQEEGGATQSLTKPLQMQTDVKISETFPAKEVHEFMEKYNQEFSTEEPPIVQSVCTKRKIFKMHPESKLGNKQWTKPCVTCRHMTTFKCSASDSYFCSRECQKEKLEEVPSELTSTTPPPKDLIRKPMLLVSSKSAKDLVVRPLEDQNNFIALMNEIALLVPSSNFYGKHCPPGKFALAYHQNQWYRGRVTETLSKRLVRVDLIDLGLERVFLMKHLKCPLGPNATKLSEEPVTSFTVTLSGVSDGISYECEKYLDELIKERTPLVPQCNGLSSMVLQVDHVGGQNLASILSGKMTMEVSNDNPSYYLKDLPANPVVAKENVPMVVTDLSDCDYAVSLAHGEYFKRCYRYETHFQQFAEASNGFYTPCSKELCLVRLKGPNQTSSRWYRAFGLLNQGDKHPRLELLDYGPVVKVNIVDIRKLPKELLYPAATLAYSPTTKIEKADVPATDGYKLYPVIVPRIIPCNAENQCDQVDFDGQLLAKAF